MWRRRVLEVVRYSNYGSMTDGFFSRWTQRILDVIDSPPFRSLIDLNEQIITRVMPMMRKAKSLGVKPLRHEPFSSIMNTIRPIKYKAVTGLIGLNAFAYMMLNSRAMKTRSQVDGLPRADRHFIASRYNISHGRIWCIPLSVFNHGDSMVKLGMNCFGLALVGPAVELALGPTVLITSFLFSGIIGSLTEVLLGNHWCRGSSAGVTGLFGIGALLAPSQFLSLWGLLNVRAASLAISIFGFEFLAGLFTNRNSEIAHMAHAAGIASAVPILYYLKWFRPRVKF